MQTKFNKTTLLSFVKATGTSEALAYGLIQTKSTTDVHGTAIASHTDSVIERVNE
jgi:hypothetical protein